MNNSLRQSLVLWLLRDAALTVIILSLCGLWSGSHQLFDLCSHFRVQYFVLLAVLAILLWRIRSPRWAIVALLGCLQNAGLILPAYFSSNSTAAVSQRLSLISFNVLLTNQRSGEVLAYLQRRQPDLILLIEVSPRWIRDLSDLNQDYPYRVIAAADGPTGIALYSKFPIRQHQLLGVNTEFFPSISAELDIAGRSIRFVGTHPPPPVTPRLYRIRNAQLAMVAETAQSADMPVIVAGDLNATPWCAGFHQLTAAGLQDSRQGFGLQPSWNSQLPLMRIPIDHVLTTKEFATLSRRIGPNHGSDHYAVEAELGMDGSQN